MLLVVMLHELYIASVLIKADCIYGGIRSSLRSESNDSPEYVFITRSLRIEVLCMK